MKMMVRNNINEEYTEVTMNEFKAMVDGAWGEGYMVDMVGTDVMYFTKQEW